MTSSFQAEGASLLPHRGSARFVCEVVPSGGDALVCVGRIPGESPFSHDGVVPGFVLMELAAQAAAIDIMARKRDGRPRPRIGYIARAHGLSWTARGVPADTPLMASVLLEGSMPPLYIYRAAVTLDGVEVFCGGFSIYVDEEAD